MIVSKIFQDLLQPYSHFVSQKNQELSMQVENVNDCSIPSMHADRKITDLSD
jgi:hypothetical protein